MQKQKIQIIHSDENILVVNKPTGVSVTKDRSGKLQLIDLLAKQMPPETVANLRLTHRLDKDTSGVLILAHTKQAQSAYSSRFGKREVHKTYLALVQGPVFKNAGQINARIIRDSKRPGQMHLTRKKGKAAKTNYRLLADFEQLALLAVSPVTVRTHQIRIHLPSIGLHLAIDPLYGSSAPILLSEIKQKKYNIPKGKTETPLIDRLTLHAYQLKLYNPFTNQPETFIAELDKNFKTTIKMLTKHNPKGQEAFQNPEDYKNIIASNQI